MNREDIIKDGLRKTKNAIVKMLDNTDANDTKRRVKIKNNLYLEVVCVRVENDDEDEVLGLHIPVGTPISIELYIIKNGEDIDGLTCRSIYKQDSMDDDIYYLLNCWV